MPRRAWSDDDCLQIRQGDESDAQNHRDGVDALQCAEVMRSERHEYAESPKRKRQDGQAEVANEMSERRCHQRFDDSKCHEAFV